MKRTTDKKALLGGVLLLQAALWLVQGIFLGAVGRENVAPYRLVALLSTVVVFGAPLALYCLGSGYRPFVSERRARVKRDGFRNPNTAWLCLIGLAATVAVSLASSQVSSYVIKFFLPQAGGGTVITPESAPYTLVKSVLLAAFSEELLFRGAIVDAYGRNEPVKTTLVSALLFGLMHYDIAAFPYAFAAGVVIAFFAVRTGSLAVAVFLHFGHNLVTFAYGLIVPEFFPDAAETITLGIFSVCLVLTILGAIVYLRFRKTGCGERKNNDVCDRTGDSESIRAGKSGLCPETAIYALVALMFSLMRHL